MCHNFFDLQNFIKTMSYTDFLYPKENLFS